MDLGTNKPSGNSTWAPRVRTDKAGRITDHEFGGDAVLGSIVSTSMVCSVKSIESAHSNLRTWNANCRQRRLQEIAYLYIVETQNGNISWYVQTRGVNLTHHADRYQIVRGHYGGRRLPQFQQLCHRALPPVNSMVAYLHIVGT